MTTKQRLGELLVKKRLVTEEQVKDALRLQVGGNRRIGYLLIKMGVINDDQLIDVLSEQLDLPIVQIDQEFSDEIRRLIPRYLCQQYSLIPLKRDGSRILQVAMTDPLDDEAITAIENFTGLAVQPMLARQKDISSSIHRHIPFSFKDIFNPQTSGALSKVAAVIALIVVISVAVAVQRYFYLEKYGTVSVIGASTVYKNHDLMVGLEPEGKISFLGHGAFAEGYYSVSFENVNGLKNFVEFQKKKFSDKQYNWLLWVTQEKIPESSG